MARRHSTPAQTPDDPFQERRRFRLRERFQLLGADFCFETDDAALANLVRAAYAGLPAHELSDDAPRLSVRLALATDPPASASAQRRSEPPPMRSYAADGILCGAMENANVVSLSPEHRSGLIVVSQEALAFPYHLRYEMLEFAVYVLASRTQHLVPLHAACVGLGGRGILLFGSSGAGKSTVSLHCLLGGLDFLAEDSVLVGPNGLATGIANFLHVRSDSLRFLADPEQLAQIRASPVIRRRSGVEKFEIDLRRPPYRLAASPLRIAAVVFLSPSRCGARRALVAPLLDRQLIRNLEGSQRYAANQPGWRSFVRRLSRLPAFELRRGRHPQQAVEALKEMLQSHPSTPARKRVQP